VLLGARDADVAEAPLFIDAARIDDRALVREEAFFHPDHVHVPKFEAFGAVEGHQGHGLFFALVVLVAVATGERGFFEEAEQRGIRGTPLVERHGVRELLHGGPAPLGFARFGKEPSELGLVGDAA
jgi:hypothetical protein